MSFDVNWDVEKYKEDHESEEHWNLRKAFLERWKTDYPEERLVCLAKVFANMEFMGCRYPAEVMHEVSRLSQEIIKDYRNSRKNKLKRTFVSASTAAGERAKGIKRQGEATHGQPSKSAKIEFIKPGQEVVTIVESSSNSENEVEDTTRNEQNIKHQRDRAKLDKSLNEYLRELSRMNCLDMRQFKESMFQTEFGRLVLLIRPWAKKIWNLQTSCNVCRLHLNSSYEDGCFTVTLNGKLVAQATGETKNEAKSVVESMAWNRLKEQVVSVVVKDHWIAQGDRISVSDVRGRPKDCFGTPLESSVATKMMKLMGWTGGGLGAGAQGIAEPIKPQMQMVNRAGLGSKPTDIRSLRIAGSKLMQRYAASDALDLDLVFSSEFSKDERAALHQLAQRAGLASRSYGDVDRFLVVKKKLDAFSIARAVIEKGGDTPKYRVFLPAGLLKNGR